MMQGRRLLLFLVLVLCLVIAYGEALARDADIIISQKADVETFDPAQSNNTSTHNVTINLFDTLVRLSDDGRDFVGELAESWKLVDQTTWQFKLRRGVKFHNGEELNAAAVKFTFDTTMDLDRLPAHTGGRLAHRRRSARRGGHHRRRALRPYQGAPGQPHRPDQPASGRADLRGPRHAARGAAEEARGAAGAELRRQRGRAREESPPRLRRAPERAHVPHHPGLRREATGLSLRP